MANIVEKILTWMVGQMRNYFVQASQHGEKRDAAKIIVPEYPIPDKKILMETDKAMLVKVT